MSDALYGLLARLGYFHPIHPVFVNMTIGLTIGAFFLCLAGNLLKRRELIASAYHVLILAFLSLMVTVPTGLMDWQRFYGGAWLLEIKMKIAMAGVLFILLSFATIIGRRLDYSHPRILFMLYFLGVMNVAGLGFFGGQLVFPGREPSAPDYQHAEHTISDGHCFNCSQVSNDSMSNQPLRSVPQLQAYENFEENGLFFTYTPEPANCMIADFSTIPTDILPNCRNVLAKWYAKNAHQTVVEFDSVSQPRAILGIDKPQLNHNRSSLHFGNREFVYFSLDDLAVGYTVYYITGIQQS